MLRVTVLVDTYNSAHFIEEAIDSILEQEFPPEEMDPTALMENPQWRI